ncbi:shikimate dehydrogenase [Pseudidiomarina gelatinasegens]|uniref:shikimate dehydrogenase n=1 Tax=Pseudidiomarina gelatinasegens TaxID=2487740 RepID=UPI0030EDED57|tara:strand:- start:1080 stop:1907 length:828 start_codon:yes stop_codon:yes gene_type:complete
MALFTVFGNPISHSLSPQIHLAFAKQLGLELNYTRSLTSVSRFRRAVAQFFREGGAGANVTVPFKEEAYELVTHVTARAKQAGAVNTLVPLGYGQLLGDNTDGIGLVRDLTQNLKQAIAQRDIVLLGAGGAARGVVGPLLAEGPRQLIIANRTLEKANAIVEVFNHRTLVAARLNEVVIPSGALVINATSASLAHQTVAVAAEQLGQAGAVYDMMYGAEPTVFMQQARQAGVAKISDGLGMLVEQAGVAFRLWHEGAELNTQAVLGELRAQQKAR